MHSYNKILKSSVLIKASVTSRYHIQAWNRKQDHGGFVFSVIKAFTLGQGRLAILDLSERAKKARDCQIAIPPSPAKAAELTVGARIMAPLEKYNHTPGNLTAPSRNRRFSFPRKEGNGSWTNKHLPLA